MKVTFDTVNKDIIFEGTTNLLELTEFCKKALKTIGEDINEYSLSENKPEYKITFPQTTPDISYPNPWDNHPYYSDKTTPYYPHQDWFVINSVLNA